MAKTCDYCNKEILGVPAWHQGYPMHPSCRLEYLMQPAAVDEQPSEKPTGIAVDWVNSPEHYKKTKYEVIDIIEAFFKDNYHLGTCFKYLARHLHKGNPKQDLEKARWYLDRYIASLDK